MRWFPWSNKNEKKTQYLSAGDSSQCCQEAIDKFSSNNQICQPFFNQTISQQKESDLQSLNQFMLLNLDFFLPYSISESSKKKLIEKDKVIEKWRAEIENDNVKLAEVRLKYTEAKQFRLELTHKALCNSLIVSPSNELISKTSTLSLNHMGLLEGLRNELEKSSVDLEEAKDQLWAKSIECTVLRNEVSTKSCFNTSNSSINNDSSNESIDYSDVIDEEKNEEDFTELSFNSNESLKFTEEDVHSNLTQKLEILLKRIQLQVSKSSRIIDSFYAKKNPNAEDLFGSEEIEFDVLCDFDLSSLQHSIYQPILTKCDNTFLNKDLKKLCDLAVNILSSWLSFCDRFVACVPCKSITLSSTQAEERKKRKNEKTARFDLLN